MQDDQKVNNVARQPSHGDHFTVELPLSRYYKDPNLELSATKVFATLNITPCQKAYESPPIVIGSFMGLAVHAQISFTYDYDEVEDTVIIRGNDDRTDKQLTISTFLSSVPGCVGNMDMLHKFRHLPNENGINATCVSMWADYVSRNRRLSGEMSATASQCNDAIIKGGIECGLSGVLAIGTPPVVNLDNIGDFKTMYGEKVLKGMPTGQMEEIIWMQKIVDSTFVGTVTWSNQNYFSNVISSTYDPKPSGYTAWYTLWADKCNGGYGTRTCSSYNSYTPNPNGKTCSTTFVGGHVIKGTTAKKMSKGSTVYIFPICNVHNGIDASYMESLYNPVGVQLNYW